MWDIVNVSEDIDTNKSEPGPSGGAIDRSLEREPYSQNAVKCHGNDGQSSHQKSNKDIIDKDNADCTAHWVIKNEGVPIVN